MSLDFGDIMSYWHQVKNKASAFFYSGLVITLLIQCNTPKKEINPLDVSVLVPVNRDWNEIEDEKTLRLITRYNSISYFLHNGLEKGFEYEFLKEFANKNNLDLEVIILQEHQNPIDLLNNGTGDIIAANYTTNGQRRLYHDFTNPYNIVNQHVILSNSFNSANSLDDLNNLKISIRKNSSYYVRLLDLQEQGFDFDIEILSEDWDTEAILLGISENQFDATIADDNLFYAARTYLENIRLGPAISEIDSVAWGIRSNSPVLKQKLNSYIRTHFKQGNGDKVKRSAFLNILTKRYYQNDKKLFAHKSSLTSTKYGGILSPYDDLIKPLADSAGLDWKMVVSVAAQESKFDPRAKSWAGAIGLMQVNHRFSPYSEFELYNEEINVREGIRILKENLDHYNYIDTLNQWALALATYNAGSGHVADARRIAIDRYKNPNDWEYVSDGLLKLMKRQYYKNARYGFCRGIETVKYVKEVLSRYEMYQTVLTLSERAETSTIRTFYNFENQTDMER